MPSYIDDKDYKFILQPHSFAAMVLLFKMMNGFSVDKTYFNITVEEPVRKSFDISFKMSGLYADTLKFDMGKDWSCYLDIIASSKVFSLEPIENSQNKVKLLVSGRVEITFQHNHSHSREKFTLGSSSITDGKFVSTNKEKPYIKFYTETVSSSGLVLIEEAVGRTQTLRTRYQAKFPS